MSALIMGSLSLASSLLGQSEENARIEQAAADFGRRKAGIEFTTKIKLSALTTQVRAAIENKTFKEDQVNKAQAEAEANNRVQAAASGVAGNSVDAVVSETERTAAEVREQLERNKDQEVRNIKLKFIDTTLNSEINTGTLDTEQRKGKGIENVLSFVQSFGNAGGFK